MGSTTIPEPPEIGCNGGKKDIPPAPHAVHEFVKIWCELAKETSFDVLELSPLFFLQFTMAWIHQKPLIDWYGYAHQVFFRSLEILRALEFHANVEHDIK